MRSKALFFTFFASLIGSGLAYAGDSKPKKEEVAQVPADTPEFFLERYAIFIPKKERKPFEELYKPVKELRKHSDKVSKQLQKLKDGDPKRVALQAQLALLNTQKTALLLALEAPIAQFWASRDPDPATPENELKKEIDDRIADIAEERFFTGLETTGLTFRSNGGFRGDLAKVYLLHGLPNETGTIENGSHFADLMLWLYLDEDGDPLYAFLFYERFGGAGGGYQLFNQSQYQMDQCGAFNELMKFRNHTYTPAGRGQCPPEVMMAAQQLQMATPTRGNLQGYVFFWAVLNFSRDPTQNVGRALEPPEPAKASAAKSGARVLGEAPKLEPVQGREYFLSTCASCKSAIPAELQLQPGAEVLMTFKENEIDWLFQGDQATYSLQARIVFENGPDVRVFEKSFVIISQKLYVTNEPVQTLAQQLLEDEELAALPAGTYRVSVYVVNTLTNKYVAWERTFVKQ